MEAFIKRISTIILAVMLLCASSVFSAGNEALADVLYELELFRGTNNGYRLEKSLSREEAATIIVRLMGEEENVLKESYNAVFSDVEKERWSYPYIMYCYENGITKGTAADRFSPSAEIPAEQFITLILRLLGYAEAEPGNAFSLAVEHKLINSEKAEEIKNKARFLRDDMVYIEYRTLMSEMADGKQFCYYLSDKNVITEEEAQRFDVYATDDIDEMIESMLG